MLEIKSYEDWSADDEEQDSVEKLKKYTDYVRSSYFKSGALTPETEKEIAVGVRDRAIMDGVVADDTPEEEANNIFSRIVGPKQDDDSDAKFVLDHLRSSKDDFDPVEYETNTNTLSKYLDLKNTVPAQADEMKDAVSEILKNKDLVKQARISAVDRGDFDVVAVDSDKGRLLYSSPYAKSDTVKGSVDTLLKSGAISTSDLAGVEDLVGSINGGISTKAKLSSYAAFEQAADAALKSDTDAAKVVSDRASALTEEKRKAQLTTGETVLAGVKAAIAMPFEFAGEGLMKVGGAVKELVTGEEAKEPEPNKYGEGASFYDVLSQNKAFADRYSPEILQEFSNNFELRKSMPAFRADKPETGIMTDTLGNPIIAPALLPKKDLFEQALTNSDLNEDQKNTARLERDRNLEAVAPSLKKLILSEEPEAVSAYAQARSQGFTDAQFVESWVSNDKNYDGFNTRVEQFGKGVLKTIVELPLGLAALASNESAAKAMGALQKDQSDREEYSRLFGDEYGIGFQLINSVPQVGTDIAATIGTAGAVAGLKSLAKAGASASAKTVLRTAAKAAVSELDDVAVASSKTALAAGGEAATGKAFSDIGKSVATKLNQATEIAPLFAVSFARSAGSTYGSIYNQLPDTMSHEDKHKQAFGYAVASGLSTGAITAGMSFLGRGAVEDIATKKIRSMALGEADEAVATGSRSVPLDKLNYKQAKLVYENIYNEGQFVKDKVFQDAMNSAIGSSYKNFIRTSLGGVANEAFEEMLDQAIQIKLEDSALDKETPLVDRINQIWTAGIVGGALGGTTETISQLTPVKKSDVTIALQARASGLQAIADRLRKVDSTATMEVVQRRMDEANAAVNAQLQQDINNSKAQQGQAKTSMNANPYDKPIKFDKEGQGALPLDVTPKTPTKTPFLADIVGDRATIGGYTGFVELADDGNVRLALDDVMDDGVTHINIGSRFMPVSKSGVSVNRNPLTVLGSDSGTIKAGTPYVVPNKKLKTQFAFPDSPDNVSVLPSLGGLDAIIVRNARMVGKESATRDLVITDPDQIKDTIEFYKLDPKMFTEPKDVGQLELDLFGEPEAAPAMTTPTLTQTEFQFGEGKAQPPAKKEASDEIKTARSLMGDNPLVLELRTLASGGFNADEIKRIATSFTPDQFADLEAKLRSVSEFALGLDDTKAKDRTSILNSVSSLSAINDRVKIARIVPSIPTKKETTKAAPTVTEAPEKPTAPATTPAATEAPKQPAKKQKRRAATPVADTTVVDDAQDPKKEAAKLEADRMNLEGSIEVPEFFGTEPTLTIAKAEELRDKALKEIKDFRDAGVTVPSQLAQATHKMAVDITAAKRKAGVELKRLSDKIEEAKKPDQPVVTEQDERTQHLIDIINGKKTVTQTPVKKTEAAKLTPAKWTETENGVFRNETEAQLFADFVSEGYYISNLAEFGFIEKKLGKDNIALNTPRAKGMPPYQVEIKQRMLAELHKRFPLVPVPESGIVTMKSKTPWGNMDSSGSSYLELPMIADSDNKPIRGFFTNDPRVTAAQMDRNKEVYVPLDLLKDPSFTLNKSIKVNKKTGLVQRVKRHPNDTGVYGAGDVSSVGTTGYKQRGIESISLLESALIEPAAVHLNNAGPTPRNRADTASTFSTYLDDAISYGSLYENTPLGEDVDKKVEVPSRIGKLLTKTFKLDSTLAEQVISDARTEYLLGLKEFGLASKIDNALTKKLLQKPDADLSDVDVYSIVRRSMTDKAGVELNPKDAAEILKANKYSGASAKDVLTNYGLALHDSLKRGAYSQGAPQFSALIIDTGNNAVEAQKRRGRLDISMKTISIEATQEEALAGSRNAFDALAQLVAQDDEVRTNVIAAEESNLTQLVSDLESNDEMYELLHGIVRKYNVPDLNPNINAEVLINLADRALASSSIETRRVITEGLTKSSSGLKLANRLLAAGWLPSVKRGGDIVSPLQNIETTAQERASLLETPTSPEAIQRNIEAIRDLINTKSDIKLSISEDVTLAADAARKVNTQELDRLGVRSGDTESVIQALEDIAESGPPKYRRIAALLLEFPEIIRNTNFHIGDFNDVRFAGAFSGKSNLVVINISGHNGRGITDVLLHEFFHASTYVTMKNPKTATQRKALARITAIRNLTKAQADKMDMESDQFTDAFTDDAEFITYALTDTRFQSMISAATPTQQRSLLRRIVDAILGLFNIDKASKDLADPLEELIDFAQMFATDTTYNINSRSAIKSKAADLTEAISEFKYSVEARLNMAARSMGIKPTQDIAFARSKKLTDEQLDYLAELEAEIEGSAMMEAIVETQPLPVSDGWLMKDGTFIAVDLAAQGNVIGTHRESIVPIIAESHPQALEEFIDEKGLISEVELDDNDVYELAKRLGYARVVSTGTELYVEADGELSARQRTALRDASIESEMGVIRDLGPNRVRQFITLYDGKMKFSPALETDTTGELKGKLTDVANELADLLPEDIRIEFDENLSGDAGVNRRDFNTINFNIKNVYRRVSGMDGPAVTASLRALVDHEVAHTAVGREFTPDQVAQVADSLGEERLQQIAEDYYSTTGLTQQEISKRVADDRASGQLTNSDIADEWLRMMVTKAATGRTYEEDIRYALKNPTLLDSFIRAIQAYINKLKQRFASYPTAETAAMVSRAARTFRQIQKGNASNVESNIMEDNRFGDSEEFFAALDGTVEGDRTMYVLPVMSSNKQKMDGFVKRVESKLYNLPAELRAVTNMRTGTINTIASSTKDFIRDFPKLRDAALSAGVSMDDIKTLFGTTAPPLTNSVLKDINDKVDSFEANLDRTGLTDEQVEARVLEYREDLKRQERLKFSTEFRKKQAAAEVAVARAGFGGLVNKAVALRKDINNFKEVIGFDESNDVYLTRAYRYFTTEGWAMAAREGGKITIEGKVVDFDRLRNTAAQAYYEQAEIELSKSGKPYTIEDVSNKTLEMLDNYLATLETMSKTSDKIAVDSLRKDLNRFKPKKDIDSTFRELLGEIDDPMANAANTLFRVGMMAANQQFRDQFVQVALDIGLASKQPKTDFVKWRSDSSFATMGPMAGLWFDPKVVGVLDETFGINMANHMANSTKMMNKMGTVVSRMSGLAVQMKTQLGIGYWPRNAIGGYIMGAAQGIFWNPLSKAGRESVIQSARGAFNRLPTEEGQREAILRLVQLNVLNDQSQGRVVQDMIRGLIATPEQELMELMADIDEARATKDAGGVLERIKQKGTFKGILDLAGSKYRSATDILGSLDGMIDGLYKVNAYYFERSVIDKHFGNTMSDEQKDEAAARKVKLTFAGHSQVVDPVQSFNRTPLANIFLPFARWKSEVFRTMFNTIPLAMEEIKQGGAMSRRGVQRLAGFIGTTTAVPTIIGTLATTVFRALSGDDEDERMLDVFERAALREALPDWQRGHSLFAQVLKGGKVQFIDMTYILPHSQLTDMIKIISDGIRTGNGVEGSRLASYVANEIIGVQIAASSVGEILSNRDDFGQPIYVETDPAPTKVIRMLTHFGKNAMTPAAAAKLIEVSRTGQQDAQEILLGEVLGVRPRTLTFGEVERRAFRNLKALQDSSVSIIGELVSGRYKSQEDVDKVVDRHQDAMNQTQSRMSNFMRTMKDLGSPESSTYASAKLFRFSDDTIQSAYAGYRIAWKPNKAWAEKAYFNAQQSEEQDPNEKVGMVFKSVGKKPDIYWVNDRIE
jgi:hypothetical protein